MNTSKRTQEEREQDEVFEILQSGTKDERDLKIIQAHMKHILKAEGHLKDEE